MVYSEFRDCNVPAGHEQLRVLKASLLHLPGGVKKVALRWDTAGIEKSCCSIAVALWGNRIRGGAAGVTQAFRAAVLETPESEWKPLIRWVESKPYATGQGPRSAMSPTGPDTAKRADYRFLAIREPLPSWRWEVAVSLADVRPERPLQTVRRS